MKGSWITWALMLAAGSLGTQGQDPARDAKLLYIDVVAVDQKESPVTDLRQDELEVWIAGYQVPIETLVAVTPGSEAARGRLVVLILDDMTLPLPLVPRTKEAARRFVNRMGPDDEMAIVMLNGSTMESTGDRARLLRAIDRYNVGPTGVVPFDRLGEQVLNTVTTIARQLAETPERRGAIVAIGASWLLDRPIPPPNIARELRQEWTAAMRMMAFANANLYVIEPAGVGSVPVGGGEGGFARETGGFAFLNTNDLTRAADQIMRETANYYLVGVADPPIQRKADLRELKVRVHRRGVTVRARRAIAGTG
jgi:VWFA-related protein